MGWTNAIYTAHLFYDSGKIYMHLERFERRVSRQRVSRRGSAGTGFHCPLAQFSQPASPHRAYLYLLREVKTGRVRHGYSDMTYIRF